MDTVKKDPRFAHIAKDPKFRRMKVSQRKVQIDKRFEGMFKDKSFKLKYSVDKRGRPMQKTTNEDLRKYYALNDSDDEKVGKKEGGNKDKKAKAVVKDDRFKDQFSSDEDEADEESEKEEAENDEEDSEESEEEKEKEEEEEEEEEDDESEEEATITSLPAISGKMPDIARGEGLESSSSEESDDEEEEEEEADEEHKWGEMDHDAPQIQEATRRLALCNMDWDRIKAHDLFMLFNSFKPADGVIKSVHIYPSEYGLERMKEEEKLGPQELRKDAPAPEPAEEDRLLDKRSDDAKEERERLRKYQLNRLKYFYAVVECDTSKTANHIYEECDGREYESSAIHLDLRFIPDDMTFDQKPKSVATGVVDASAYKPNLFVTTALQQSKVQCTWDETDRDRLAVTMKKYTKDELENLDIKDYLASSSDEEAEDIYAGFIEQPDFGKPEVEDDEDKRLETYKELMQTIKAKDRKKEEKETELEISWEPGLKETTEEIIKNKKKKETETVWEQYLGKKKEKKKEKLKKSKNNAENNNTPSAEVVQPDGEEEDEEDGEMSDDQIPSDVDMNDPYFREELESAEKSGKAKSGKGILKKKKKYIKEKLTPEEEKQKKKEEAELEMLMEDEDDDKEHFSLKAIMDAEKMSGKKKKKRSHKQMMRQALKAGKKTVQDSFKMDLEDQRFSAVFDTADYNIDPSASEFKATKNMENLIQEKLKRKSKKQDKAEKNKNMSGIEAKRLKLENSDKSAKDNSLAKLVTSVKMKTKSHQIKKNS